MNEKSNSIAIWYNELTKNDSYLLFLFLANLIVRIIHHLIYEPIIFTDTLSYLELSSLIIEGNFSDYQAIRPPVYPIVLFFHYIDDRAVWLIQSMMGVMISIIIYLIIKKIVSSKTAFVTALIYSLSFNILFAEAALLSETTSIFFLMLTFYAFTRFIDANKNKYLFYVGLFTSLSILTRPIMIVLIPAILITIYVM